MENTLRSNLEWECKKLIDRYYDYLFELEESSRRKSKRFGCSVSKKVLQPNYWNIDEAFNPFKVRSSKVLETYLHTLTEKLKNLEYKPQKAIIHRVTKESGGERELNIFQIPDEAVSRLVYKSLLDKNVNAFSNYAYAYREDRSAQDAIRRISTDWKDRDRIFVAEFDFSHFFDNISHKYLLNVFLTKGFLHSEMEEYVAGQFLTSRYSEESSYYSKKCDVRKKGIPQGTSISLFLANLVCWELDKELESIGVQFARYADDTLIWSNSYVKVVQAYEAINSFSRQMDVPINMVKSEGINLISEKDSEELRTKATVKYLGCNISLRKVSISDKTVDKIKKKINYIIYENLLQPLNQNTYNLNRLSLIDWDYLTTLAQIRRYLYGGLNDKTLRRFRLGIINELRFRGVMSYYPLVNDEEQLRNLDGWLIFTLKTILYKRQSLWQTHSSTTLPGPINDWIDNITDIKRWENPKTHIVYDFRIPSFLQINRTIKIGLSRGGISSVTNPKSKYYPGSNHTKSMP